MDVINLFVMGDELSVDASPFDVPDRAGCIDGAGANEVGHDRIPIKGGERGTELIFLNGEIITFLRLRRRLTSLFSTILQIFKFSPEVANKSVEGF